MRKSTPIFLSVTVLLIVSLACASSSVPTQDINTIMQTAIMQTMVSALTQTADVIVPVDVAGTPTASLTPIFTTTETLTPSPAFTITPIVPQIRVSVATNCRVGPGKVYDRIGTLLVGQVADIVGRDATGNYWYIRNPNQSNSFCWLWGQYATLSGNTAALPMITPPPTPTPMPAFEVYYDGLETCSGWWTDLQLSNTGGVSFESLSLTVKDLDTDILVSMYTDIFSNTHGCGNATTTDVLNPDSMHVVSAPPFAYDPSGHTLRATITLCSREGQNGTCLTESIKFIP